MLENKPAIIPRDYQLECIYGMITYLCEQNGHGLAAMPTGSGKAVCIAGIIQLMSYYWPRIRFLQLVDTQELVEQNAKTLRRMAPHLHQGIYCAGLDKKEIAAPIIFGSLGSVRNNTEAFGFRDILIIDEVQGVSPDEETGYRQIIAKLTEINPNLRVIGFSATIFRLGQGYLHGEGGFFNDLVFDITTRGAFLRLIVEGWLSPPIPKSTSFQIDVSNVKMNRGDYAQGTLQKVVDKQEITHAAIREALQLGYDRQSWLIFSSGVEHCEHIKEILDSYGIDSVVIHSKITKEERKERLHAFKTGKVRAIIGYKVLTKGFDHPPIDLIIDLYPTMSPGMHVQKYGRGTRPYDCNNLQQYIKGFDYVKKNCLILDFAGNTRRLGCINDPVIPHKKGNRVGDAPVKICDQCGIYNHASARYCGGKPYPSDEGCGAEFKFKTKLVTTAGTDVLIAGDVPVVETRIVTRVIYHKHTKIGSNPCIKVSYYCGMQRFTEYVCLEAKGYALTRARNWWLQRHNSTPPTTTDDALLYVSQLRMPKRINVMKNGQYYEVKSVEWD